VLNYRIDDLEVLMKNKIRLSWSSVCWIIILINIIIGYLALKSDPGESQQCVPNMSGAQGMCRCIEPYPRCVAGTRQTGVMYDCACKNKYETADPDNPTYCIETSSKCPAGYIKVDVGNYSLWVRKNKDPDPYKQNNTERLCFKLPDI
jgi:hypothetical protein